MSTSSVDAFTYAGYNTSLCLVKLILLEEISISLSKKPQTIKRIQDYHSIQFAK